MVLTRPLQFVLALALAAASVGGLRHFDAERRWASSEQAALRLARQVATQAEGMLLSAMEKGEFDPLRWSANILSQGNEPRVIRVYKAHFDPAKAPLPGADNFRLDRQQLFFEYSRLARPQDSSGFKVQVRLEPVGFLGAETRLVSDLLTGTLGAGFFVVYFALFQLFLRKEEEGGTEQLTALANSFTLETRNALVQLGGHIREMVREAQAMAAASSRARDLVVSLRDKVHADLEGVHQFRARSKEVLKGGQDAETVALNLVIEASRLGENGKPLTAMAEQLYRFVQQMRKLGESADDISAALETHLEPITTDADEAHQVFQNLPQHVSTLDQHIRKSTESLIAQAKLVQSTRAALLGDRPPVADTQRGPGQASAEARVPPLPERKSA